MENLKTKTTDEQISKSEFLCPRHGLPRSAKMKPSTRPGNNFLESED